MPEFWETFKSAFSKDAKTLTYVELPDPTSTVSSINEGEHYFRIWLSQMFLTKGEKWFVTQHPAVNTQVTVKFGGFERMTFSRVTAPTQESFSQGFFVNYPLTELLPYRGGLVELTAGLLAMPGDNNWKTVVKILEKFSSLVTPPLGQALALAQQVSGSASEFFGQSSGKPHLGLHQAFTAAGGGGGSGFRPGYLAVILAPTGTYPSSELVVQDNLLYWKKPGGVATAISNHDFMLFRIEARQGRDDFMLKNIDEPFREACAAAAIGEEKKAKACKDAAIAAAILSPDLTWPDQRRARELIKNRLAELSDGGQGAAPLPASEDEWGTEMQRLIQVHAPSLGQAIALGPVDSEEAFDD